MSDLQWYEMGPKDHEWPIADPPRGATPIGHPDEQTLAIYLGSKAMDSIEKSLAQHGSAGVSGLLLGRPFTNGSQRFIAVTDCIFSDPSSTGDNSDARFNANELDRMQLIWEQHAPHLMVVGWFHASPNRDENITPLERFTHKRLFSRPWHVALIIDSTRQTSRLYNWQRGQLLACAGFYYFDAMPIPVFKVNDEVDHGKTTATPVATAKTAPLQRQPKQRSGTPYVVLTLLLLYFLIPGVPGSVTSFNKLVAQQREHLTELKQQLHQLESESEMLEQLQVEWQIHVHEMLTDSETTTPSPPTVSTSDASGPLNRSAPDALFPASSDQDGEQYVIQPGDTMWNISRRLVGDPNAYLGLAESNNIENPDLIFPGQTINAPPQ